MATEGTVSALQKVLNTILAFQNAELINRPEWGRINFESARQALQQVFGISNDLNILPIQQLPDGIVGNFQQRLEPVVGILTHIGSFSIETGNAVAQRDQLISQIIEAANYLVIETAPWIPFLAYKKGDVNKNIEELTRTVKNANTLVEESKTKIALSASEIEKIITQAREASASVGAAVFTQDFLTEAESLNHQATNWLRAAAISACATMATAGAFWHFTEANLDQGQLVQKFGTKLIVLVLLFTVVLWCGKTYRALKHQAAVYRQRGLGLRTFQAFSHAASDAQTKDAVLMETTRSIFANGQTGYIESDGGESEVKIVEVVRSILSKDNSKS